MLRPVPSVLAILVAMAAAPAIAADYDDWGGDGYEDGLPDFRTTYPTEPGDWAGLGDNDDPLRFEFGTRYYYSMGSQSWNINTGLPGEHGQMEEKDTSHFLEGHLRIDDESTNSWVKGLAGFAFTTNGSVTDDIGTTPVTGGHLGYAGADFGYSVFGNTKTMGLSPFLGYMYWNDSPNTYSDNFTTAETADDIVFDPTTGQTSFPGDSEVNDFNLNMLRLGVAADANIGGYFDISVEAAAVPYANLKGTMGAGSGPADGHWVVYDNPSGYGPTGFTGAYNFHDIQSSPTTVAGWGYGGMGQAMLGFHPTENLTFRLGARAWYVQGKYDATFGRAFIGDPSDSNPPVAPVDPIPADPTAVPPTPAVPGVPGELNPPNFDTPPSFGNATYITRDNPFKMFRYGLLAELTYSF